MNFTVGDRLPRVYEFSPRVSSSVAWAAPINRKNEKLVAD